MDIKKDPVINGVVYSAAAIGTAVASVKGWHGLEFVCKPLMLIVLSSWFFFNSRRYGDRFTLLVQAGLLFSLIGDVALMFQHKDEFNFLIGLGAFLIAQLCYTMAFAHNIAEVGGTEGLGLSTGLSFVVLVYVVLFSWDLMPHIEEGLGAPVIAYVIAISLMGMLAAFRWTRTYSRSFWLVLAGAALFIASDSLLATTRFIKPLAWGSVAVTITYAAAQFLIASGCLLHILDPVTIRRRQAAEA